MEYPKTENLYASNGEQNASRKRGPEFGFRASGADQISKWLVTEKVDGMNMRVVFEPAADEPVCVLGRTERAQIPNELRAAILEWATFPNLATAFVDDEGLGPAKAILFGEGFGPGIQKAGQAYGGEKRFILFDVLVGDWWLSWDDVVDVARKLGVETVPVLGRDVSLEDAEALVCDSRLLSPDSMHIEGIVARTDPYLFDGRGHRVMFKYKVRDLA